MVAACHHNRVSPRASIAALGADLPPGVAIGAGGLLYLENGGRGEQSAASSQSGGLAAPDRATPTSLLDLRRVAFPPSSRGLRAAFSGEVVA